MSNSGSIIPFRIDLKEILLIFPAAIPINYRSPPRLPISGFRLMRDKGGGGVLTKQSSRRAFVPDDSMRATCT